MEKIIQVSGLSKNYGKQKVLENIEFSMTKGEIVGLVGPNGAGKTTLMKIIAGLIKKYDGNIRFANRKVKIGCVIENPGFYTYMTGNENLKYFGEYGGVGKDLKNELSNVAELLGLSKAIDKKVNGYSLGMKQRLGIAQALLGKPELLILDEPTNGLDPEGIKEIRAYLRKLVENTDSSILISSHLLDEIEKICDRVVIIKNGKMIECIDLNRKKDSNVANRLVVETTQCEKAMIILKENGIETTTFGKNKLLILGMTSVNEIFSLLSEKSIEIGGVYKESESLEEKFINLVGGTEIE